MKVRNVGKVLLKREYQKSLLTLSTYHSKLSQNDVNDQWSVVTCKCHKLPYGQVSL